MSQSCLPADLIAAAKCFRCLTPSQLNAVKTYLLCNYPTVPAPLTIDILDTSVLNNLTISWTQSETPDTNEVWVSRNGAAYVLFATVAGATTTAPDLTAMLAGDIWYYKVRAVTGGTASDFTDPAGAIREYTFTANPAVINIGLPDVVIAFGNVNAVNCINLLTFSWPKLHTHKLVGAAITLGCNTNPALTLVSLPNLVTTNAALNINNNASLVTLIASSLTSIGVSGCNLSVNPSITSISFPALVTAVGGISVRACTSLVSLSLPSLVTIGIAWDFSDCSSLTIVTVPSLTTVPDINATNCTSIVTLDLSTVISSGAGSTGGFFFNACPLLTNFDINLAFDDNLITITFDGDNLTDTSVNKVLAMGVAGATTSNDYQLGGGTNAAPTGQGILDKAALILAGNTVATN